MDLGGCKIVSTTFYLMESIYTPFCLSQPMNPKKVQGWTLDRQLRTANGLSDGICGSMFFIHLSCIYFDFSRRKVSCPKSWCKSDVDPARIRCCHQHRLSNKTYSAIPEQRTRGQLCYTVLPIFFFFSKSSQLITN